MENDLPRLADEQTPESKRHWLRGNFLVSWLKRESASEPEADTEEGDEAETKELKKSEKKTWWPAKISRWTRDAYQRTVKLEMMPFSKSKKDEEKLAKPDKYSQEGDNVKRAGAEKTKRQDQAMEYEPMPPAAESEEEEQDEQGLLLVSDESIKRYRKQSREKQSQKIEEDEPLPQRLEATNDNNGSGRIERVIAKKEAWQPAQSAGEILRQKHLKREVKKIKQHAMSAKGELEQIKSRQEAFQKELLKREALNRRLLRQRLAHPDYESLPPQIIPEKTAADRAQTIEAKTVLTPLSFERPREIQQAKLKEFLVKEASSQPERILEKVERAAEHNIPIESLYERRHEVKDEANKPDKILAIGAGTIASLAKLQENLRRQIKTLYPKPSIGQPNLMQSGTDLYKQAVKSGFWTAIAICILMFIAFLAT